jgi:murein DD-endopeptidase MepM/ murein hydrolase activator NlpD
MPAPSRGIQSSQSAEERNRLAGALEAGIARVFARTAAIVYRLSGDWSDFRPLISRFSAHMAVLTVALLGALLSNVDWPAQAASPLSVSAALPEAPGEDRGIEAAASDQMNLAASQIRATSTEVTYISRRPNPHTVMPERPRLDIVTYTVQAGDTIQSIADGFDLEPTTILWANPAVEDAPDLLRIGQEIIVLPINGVYHRVKEGDTVASIAEAYGVERRTIITCEYNDLGWADRGIQVGSALIVPGGEKPYEPKKVTTYAGPVPEGARGTGAFQWPVLGTITQGYWYGHRAIDVGAPTGSAVLATDGGFVSFAGWTDVGYGYLIVVDHANGFSTYYAHLSNIYVAEGQDLRRGQVIGAVGNTGNSTGPHLHFEVRRHNTQQNPRAYLP